MKRPPPRPPSNKPPRRTSWDDPELPKPIAARDPFAPDPLAPSEAATPPAAGPASPTTTAPPADSSVASPGAPSTASPSVTSSVAPSTAATSSTAAPVVAVPPPPPPSRAPAPPRPAPRPSTPIVATPPSAAPRPSWPAPPDATPSAAPGTSHATWVGLVLLAIGAAAAWFLRPILLPPPPPAPALPSVALDSLAWRGARLRARLERLDAPTSAEEAPMRQPRTAPYRDHLTLGDSLGVPPLRGEGDLADLVGRGRLVPLATNERYVVRVLEHSKPYATPATAAWLDDVARRFQQRLGEAGLPPFRLVVSSVLRTADLQADLRRVNRNAATGRSSHEYGVSVDIDHTEFRAPAYIPPLGLPTTDAQASLGDYLSRLHTDDLARAYWPHLFGVLTRVMAEEQSEERALVLLESEQPVFHVTVGRVRRAAPLTGEPSAGDTSGG